MTPTRFTLVASALLAAAMAVQAAEDGYTVRTLDYRGGSQSSGQMTLFYVNDAYSESENVLPISDEQASRSTPWVSVRAASGVAWVFESNRIVAAEGDVIIPGEEQPTPTQLPLTDLMLQLDGHDAGYQIHMFSAGGPAVFTATGSAGEMWSFDGPAMGPGAWYDEQGEAPPVGAPLDEEPSTFARVAADSPQVVHTAQEVGFTFSAAGDVYLEFFRVTLAGHDASGDQSFATGYFLSPVDPALGPLQPAVANQERRFVRMLLRDAVVEIAADEGVPDAHWATAATTMVADGPVTIHQMGGGQTMLPGGTEFTLVPTADFLDVRMGGGNANPQSTSVDLASRQSATLVGVGAVLALLAAIGVGLMRRWTTTPQLADVERSIEAGRFRRAARMAGRILRKAPGLEDAVLARGIALSKSGRSARAARELGAHIADKGASDGSLHYVLGLAYLDIGRQPEGLAALREAVRLTPSLASEVAPRLGQAAPSPSTSFLVAKEAHGYA